MIVLLPACNSCLDGVRLLLYFRSSLKMPRCGSVITGAGNTGLDAFDKSMSECLNA